ncbi:MAG: tRNA preQ1(34) S-adenosylmethionine ribosyltransferase-isomerase QueA [Tissierellia bacterium]|nr:tRNA preQ1(34) S-adenosylmethionine ribosyltransferase-isomerase QueA [Tissierellia bacterium]
MKTRDFYYDLPPELIAQKPLKNRSDSRMMVLKKDEQTWNHDEFIHIGQYLRPGDTLVFNDTKVSPVRIFGHRPDKDESIEVLLLRETLPKSWICLVKPGRKLSVGTSIIFSEELRGVVSEILPDGERVIDLAYDGILYEILDKIGYMPLPPYISETLEDRDRYQTIYAKYRGSSAAPTAGLHFTEEILDQLKNIGINTAFATLHIGLGTFRPVKVENIEEHPMHEEWFSLTEENAKIINDTRKNGGRVIAVGTTSARTLESIAQKAGEIVAMDGDTSIFIFPGYEFKAIDGLLTNFHLPESTLIMMISALAGKEFVMNAYADAVDKRYRFFSLGDSMLII